MEEDEQLKFKMGSAVEIEIEDWYETLPPTIRFDRNINLDAPPVYGRLAPLIEHNVAMLRGSYMAIPAMACWEMVLSATAFNPSGNGMEELPPGHRDSVKKFQLGLMNFIASAKQYLDDKFHPMVWIQVQAYNPTVVRVS